MTREELKKIKLPDEPGVYFFRDQKRRILYIGKAASLKDRVRSYFTNDVATSRSPAIAGLVGKTASVDYQTTDSVLEALILEANLIKKHQPPYNVDEKDNKSFNYLVITKESPPAGGFPRVLVVRGRELFLNYGFRKPIYGFTKSIHVFGPFPQGGSLKEALKLVRKIFPFRDTCEPRSGKPCFNRQIGLCPGVCSGEINEMEYKRTIRNISELFSGKMHSLKRRLEKEMKNAAKSEDFETAEVLRRQVRALTHIRDVSLIKDEFRVAPGGSFRIEGYDVAHTSGTGVVGVMTVVSEGQPQKSEYRMFKIRGVTNDDTGALKEMLERRLAHPEWTMPKLIVIDGGKAQLNAAAKVLKKAGVVIPLVAVTKDEFHRPREIIGDSRTKSAYEKEILLANAESHRFGIRFHRKRRRKMML